MKYVPLHHRVLLEVMAPQAKSAEEPEFKKTAGGILLAPAPEDSTSMQQTDKNLRHAKVLSCGEGEVLYTGNKRPLRVSEGMIVLVDLHHVLPVSDQSDPYASFEGIIDEREILALAYD